MNRMINEAAEQISIGCRTTHGLICLWSNNQVGECLLQATKLQSGPRALGPSEGSKEKTIVNIDGLMYGVRSLPLVPQQDLTRIYVTILKVYCIGVGSFELPPK